MSGTGQPGLFNDPSLAALIADPRFGALAGMTQNFAQAAMPSRMPVPIGAVLGMAGSGAMQGAGNSYQLQLAQQQAEAANMNNQLLFAGLPFREKVLGSLGSGNGQVAATSPSQGSGGGGSMVASNGAPFGAPPMGSGGGGGGGDGGGGGWNPLLDPVMLKNLGIYQSVTNQGRAAAALFGNLQTAAGGPGYAFSSDGRTSNYVPGGPADPSVIGRNAAAEAFSKLPAQMQQQIQQGNVDAWKNWTQPRDQGNGVIAPMQGPAPTYGGGSASAPQTSANPSDPGPGYAVTKNALASLPSDSTRMMALNAALSAGLPLPAIAPWIASVHTESGWNLNIPDGSKGEVGVAQVRPGTAAMFGISPDQLRNPNTNLLASARYFGQQWQKANGNPNGAFAGYNTGDVNGNAPDYQNKSLQKLQQFGYQPPGGKEVAPGVTQQQLAGGGVVTTSTRPLMDKQFQADTEELHGVDGELDQAQAQQARLLHMREVMQNLPTGSGGETRAALANAVETFMPSMKNSWLTRSAQLPDASLAQEFAKMSLMSAGEQERGVLGGRGGYRAIQMYQKANPSLDLTPQANRDIINMQLIAHQADVDYMQGEQQFITKNQSDYAAGNGRYTPSTQFDTAWRTQRNPQVYSAAMAAANGKPFNEWAKGLNKDEGLRVLQVIGRADPSSTVLGDDGKPWPVTQFTQNGP